MIYFTMTFSLLSYVICKTEDRLWWLFKVLKKTRKQKVMVFFSSCKSVEFHHEFFSRHCNAPVLCIHVSEKVVFCTINQDPTIKRNITEMDL